MVSRVEIIVFIIRGSFFEVYGEKEKSLKSMAFRCLTKKLTVNKCCKIVIIINF